MVDFKKGDRVVAENDSYYVATVTFVGHVYVFVEFDVHGRYLAMRRDDFIHKSRISLAQPYQEFHNAASMQKDGVPTCFPITWEGI